MRFMIPDYCRSTKYAALRSPFLPDNCFHNPLVFYLDLSAVWKLTANHCHISRGKDSTEFWRKPCVAACFSRTAVIPNDKRATEPSQRLGVAVESNFHEVLDVHVTYTCPMKKETGPQNTKSLGKGRSR